MIDKNAKFYKYEINTEAHYSETDKDELTLRKAKGFVIASDIYDALHRLSNQYEWHDESGNRYCKIYDWNISEMMDDDTDDCVLEYDDEEE